MEREELRGSALLKAKSEGVEKSGETAGDIPGGRARTTAHLPHEHGTSVTGNHGRVLFLSQHDGWGERQLISTAPSANFDTAAGGRGLWRGIHRKSLYGQALQPSPLAWLDVERPRQKWNRYQRGRRVSDVQDHNKRAGGREGLGWIGSSC